MTIHAPAVESARAAIDRWLTIIKDREHFGAIEIKDMLLDIRGGLEVEEAAIIAGEPEAAVRRRRTAPVFWKPSQPDA